MIRTIVLLPLVAAVLACGILNGGGDPAEERQVVVVEVFDDHAGGANQQIDAPLVTADRIVEATGDRALPLYAGDSTIEEKIIENEVIVKATMTSFSSEVFIGADSKYFVVLKFNFDTSEYLKGTGPPSIVAVWVDGIPYDTNDEAEDAKAIILADRDDQWDDREAIIFLYGFLSGFGSSLDAQLQLADHFLLYVGDPYSTDDFYSLHSRRHKSWLPAASSAGPAGDGQEYLLDVPPDTGTPPTITLGDLKTRIADVTAEYDGGDGSEAHKTCVLEKYRYLRNQRNWPEERDTSYTVWNIDQSFASGQPAGTELDRTESWGVYPNSKVTLRFEGRDSALFATADGDTTAFDRDGDGDLETIKYDQIVRLARPVPAGGYKFDLIETWPEYALCNFDITNEWTITAVAPEGTLHEAFFDPVTDGTAVAADDTNGVLKPATFTDADGTSATIERIAWEPGTVKLELDPQTVIAAHIVDFIALDGSVPLSLKVADATADAETDTLSWSVASQPWHDGDELMLRVREVPDCSNGTVVPNPSANPALKRDCINLLAAKDTLRGTATLNWSEDTAITSWDGVRVKGSPGRVAEVLLTSKGLTGTIPPDLGRLDGLQHLWFNINQLAGAIPSELGSLADLQTLILNDNRLTGAVPRELGGLSSLETLWLDRNRLSGEIPAALGDLSSLRRLTLSVNRLSGSIPSDLGNLTNLEYLWLNVNRLTGTIPSELGSLDDLRNLRLGSNQLTGCIPPALRDIDDTDLDNLGLQNCPTP